MKKLDYLKKEYIQEIQDLLDDLKSKHKPEELNENLITDLIDEKLEKVVDGNDDDLYAYNLALTLLEIYLEYNFDSFVQTEKVYHYAKRICQRKNMELNQARSYY